jgi:hypothetical protein
MSVVAGEEGNMKQPAGGGQEGRLERGRIM